MINLLIGSPTRPLVIHKLAPLTRVHGALSGPLPAEQPVDKAVETVDSPDIAVAWTRFKRHRVPEPEAGKLRNSSLPLAPGGSTVWPVASPPAAVVLARLVR